MSRRAILISSPGEPGKPNYCKGVYVDVQNYRRILLSAEGGAWREDEITVADEPTADQLSRWASSNPRYDYVLIMFTGHGEYSLRHQDRVLWLRPNESILSSDLIRGIRKATMILDCCQRPEAELRENVEEVVRLHTFAAAHMRVANAEACRDMYDRIVARAPDGVLKMTSCNVGETSADDDRRGGRYNGSLIASIESWVKDMRTDHRNPVGFHSMVEAHEQATAMTQRLSGGRQNPTIEKPRTGSYFPAAVFV